MTIRLRHTFCVAALLVSGCGVFISYPTIRYRLRVEVDTPSGVRTGSSVMQISCSSTHTQVPWINGVGCETKGEAVAVDLLGGKTLFALLTRPGESGGGAGYAFLAFPSNHAPSADPGVAITEVAAKTGTAILPRHVNSLVEQHAESDPPSAYPMLVTFKNIEDPKSVVAVDADHLDATFGAGVKLRRITVTMTDDAVTTGIVKRLRWLGTSVRGYLDGQVTGGGPELANILETGSFKASIYND